MHLNASPRIFRNASLLRNNQTPAEEKLWEHLKDRQMEKEKFRRQHPFKKYVGDLYCYKLRLVIEVDGKHHNQPPQIFYDQDRTELLEAEGLMIIRFSNEAVMNSIEFVLDVIRSKVRELQANRIARKNKT